MRRLPNLDVDTKEKAREKQIFNTAENFTEAQDALENLLYQIDKYQVMYYPLYIIHYCHVVWTGR